MDRGPSSPGALRPGKNLLHARVGPRGSLGSDKGLRGRSGGTLSRNGGGDSGRTPAAREHEGESRKEYGKMDDVTCPHGSFTPLFLSIRVRVRPGGDGHIPKPSPNEVVQGSVVLAVHDVKRSSRAKLDGSLGDTAPRQTTRRSTHNAEKTETQPLTGVQGQGDPGGHQG